MIRSLTNFVVLVALTLMLPVACVAAWGWGSPDEKSLMKLSFCVLAPFCADFWYLIFWHVALKKESRYLVQLMIFVLGYAAIVLLLKFRMVTF